MHKDEKLEMYIKDARRIDRENYRICNELKDFKRKYIRFACSVALFCVAQTTLNILVFFELFR